MGVDIADTVWLEVCKYDNFAADKHFGGVSFLNRRHNHTLANTVKECELEARVRFANGFSLGDFANTQVKLCKVFDVNLFFNRLNGVGFANLGSSFFFGSALLAGSVSGDFCLGLRVGEIQKTNVLISLNSIEEEIETGTFFLVDEQTVNGAEEITLQALEFFVGHFGTVNGFGNSIKLGVELVQRVAAFCNVSVKQLDCFLFLFVQRAPNLKVAGCAQAVDLVGSALFEPEFCAVETVGKLFCCVRCTDFFEYRLQHRYVKVNDRAELNQKGHRNSFKLAAVDLAVIHNICNGVGCLAFANVGQHLVKLKVLAKNTVIKAEVERLGGVGLGIEPEDDFGLIKLEQSFGSEVKTGRRGHFTRHSLNTDELITLIDGGFVTENLFCNLLGVVVRTCGSGVILSARLKVNALVSPTHCPVYLPTKLAVVVFNKVEMSGVTATAGVICFGSVLIERGDGCKVGMTFGTEDAYGRVSSLFGIVLGFELFFTLGGILGFEGIENFKNFASFANRFQNGIGISTGAVHICLITAIELDAKGSDTAQELVLKVLCIIFVATPRVGNIDVGATDIFVIGISNNGLYVSGDFTATVVLIPRDQQSCLLAILLQSLYNKQRGCNVTEVANVNRARGADTRGANVFFFFGVTRNNSLRNFF